MHDRGSISGKSLGDMKAEKCSGWTCWLGGHAGYKNFLWGYSGVGVCYWVGSYKQPINTRLFVNLYIETRGGEREGGRRGGGEEAEETGKREGEDEERRATKRRLK
jgi:hypothetical protein